MKIIKIFTMTIAILMLMSGCKVNNIKNNSGAANTNGNTNKSCSIEKIDIISGSKNVNHLYRVNYPYSYVIFDEKAKKDGRKTHIDLDYQIKREDISAEDVDYILNYVATLPDNYKFGTDLTYDVSIRYTDESGESIYLNKRSSEQFPSGWDDFVDKLNEIFGEELLTKNKEIQAVTPEFLTELFGVTDDDVKDGTLQNVIDSQFIDLIKLNDSFQINEMLSRYYASTKEELIEPYRPKELISIDSTDDEYDKFVLKYLDKIGYDISLEKDSDQEYFRYFRDDETRKYFYIAKTSDIDKLPTVYDDLFGYQMALDAHMEDMTFTVEFIYNSDKKFILVPIDNDPDFILPFVE